jgi:hypothetical protein
MRRLTNRCSGPHHHKLLGRGRVVSASWRTPRARVLTRQPAAAELSRQAPVMEHVALLTTLDSRRVGAWVNVTS